MNNIFAACEYAQRTSWRMIVCALFMIVPGTHKLHPAEVTDRKQLKGSPERKQNGKKIE